MACGSCSTVIHWSPKRDAYDSLRTGPAGDTAYMPNHQGHPVEVGRWPILLASSGRISAGEVDDRKSMSSRPFENTQNLLRH